MRGSLRLAIHAVQSLAHRQDSLLRGSEAVMAHRMASGAAERTNRSRDPTWVRSAQFRRFRDSRCSRKPAAPERLQIPHLETVRRTGPLLASSLKALGAAAVATA
jgi:hypothetical protein